MNIFRHKLCPLCGSDKIIKSGDISYEVPVFFSNHEIGIESNPELWRCGSCKSAFVQNIVPEEDAKRLYSEGTGDRWSNLPFSEKQIEEIVGELSKLLRPGIKVLDIGSNTGELLDYAHSKGCTTYGVEFSQRARIISERKGHKIFSSLSEVKGSFDIITAFDLIEHLYAPCLFINKCKGMLSSQGVLIIQTGDISSLSARVAKAKWWYIKYPEHIVFPSKKYFSFHSGLVVKKWLRTYANKSYRYPLNVVCHEFIIKKFKGKYTGIPSLGPDHVFVIMGKI